MEPETLRGSRALFWPKENFLLLLPRALHATCCCLLRRVPLLRLATFLMPYTLGPMKHIYHCIGHELKIPNIIRAEGVYVYDDEGNRYMDLEAGVWCISVGHRNPRVNRAIREQSDAVIQAGFCYSTPIVDRAAKRLLRTVGMDKGKCVFLCSGSEAIEIGRQIAKHLTGNEISMTLHDSYLGAYSAVSNRRKGWYQLDWTPCVTCKNNHQCDKSCELLQGIPSQLSEFVFEPGSASGYVRFPPKAMIRNVVEIVRENGGKILINEVTTGTGRTGRWWGYQHYDIDPDLVAIGKGIGNGYPVSVATVSEHTIAELTEKPFKYAQSHQNDPLGAAVVDAVVETIEAEALINKAEELGEELIGALERYVDGRVVTAVRGRGLMVAVELRDAETTERIHSELIRRGQIVGNRGSFLRIDPPLTITREEVELFREVFGEVLTEVRASR